ncbi:transposase [Leuconostoc pseudomesenteroides]|nr:transposase [Leuconostoc pseudomesenteroides]
MKAKRYSTEFKSSIVTLYNEGRSANSLANEYHLAVQTVTGWVNKSGRFTGVTTQFVLSKLDARRRV